MSCFICDDAHITALAAYAVSNNLFSREHNAVLMVKYPRLNDAEALAHEMFDENAKAYSNNYSGRYDSEVGTFTYDRETAIKARRGAFSAVEIIKSAQCYEYQACDSKTWDDSIAKRVIRAIVGHAIQALPGYESATWGAPSSREVAA